MIFSSLEFIFLFLPPVLALYFSLRNHYARLMMILVTSYLFYGFWNYKFMALLLFSTALDFYLGLLIHEASDPTRRKRLLLASLVINLGFLGFFKYFNFFMETLAMVLAWTGVHSWRLPKVEVDLPIGISFYTFISLSYTIDVYYRRSVPHRDFPAYAGFVSFFPHLVAGPLIRHNELVHQLEDPSRGRFNGANFSDGLWFFIIGLSKKVLIADRLADGVNPVLRSIHSASTLEAWLCAFGYAFQLYFDFSGYSDMAVGLAKMMNIEFPQNFRSPYKATSITDFWQRWHISLSQWLRDYLYIPLGGNRNGTLKTYRNLFLTMLLGGLWHGANWVFILWGAFHGGWLALERLAQGTPLGAWAARAPAPAKRLWVFAWVTLGWVFFRAPDLGTAWAWLSRMFSPQLTYSLHSFEPGFRDRFYAAFVLGGGIAFFAKNSWEIDLKALQSRRGACLAALLFVASVAFFSKKAPFLYFQF